MAARKLGERRASPGFARPFRFIDELKERGKTRGLESFLAAETNTAFFFTANRLVLKVASSSSMAATLQKLPS